MLTADEIRSSAWRRLHTGAYADAEIPLTHGLRCAAAHLVIPAKAAVGGRSAAWLHGVKLLQTDDPVEITSPKECRWGPVRGLKIRYTELPAADVQEGKPRVTTPLRTAWDIARFTDVVEAVAFLDAMVADRLVSVDDLQKRLRECKVAWGRRRVTTALALVDPRAESPQESRLRVRLVLAGLPCPEVQHTVRVDGRFIARVDLAWPDRRVAVEYDGVWHADAAQLHRDRRRLNKLVGAGWTVLHVTAARMHSEFPCVVEEIRAALAR
jgi:very-short-patch-repair endonuclease